MNKSIITALCAGLVLGFDVGRIPTSLPVPKPSGEPQLKGQIVLAKTWSNGTRQETGLRVPYDPTGLDSGASILLSPDKTKAISTTWENAKINLYYSDIDGSNWKKIAEQVVPEGSGGLDVGTIKWSEDGTHITYSEFGLLCPGGTCKVPADYKNGRYDYSVDLQTGQKTLVSSQKL